MTNKLSRKSLAWALAGATALAVSAPAISRADAKTERTWKAKCASCHGVTGAADTDKGGQMKIPDFSTGAWQKSKTTDDLTQAINEGVSTTKDGVKKEMDGYKDSLSADQVSALVAYIRTLGK